jgi:hypothetical protein
MWYSGAMLSRSILLLAVVTLLVCTASPEFAQSTDEPTTTQPKSSIANPSSKTAPAPPRAQRGNDCNGTPCDEVQPRVFAMPPPTSTTWTLHEKIGWGANVLLAALGYVGIMLAISTLRKIERHTHATGIAAEAAAEAAQAALLNARAIINSERPWILISVEPSAEKLNSFTVIATNRGRTPASIIAKTEQTRIALDEHALPAVPGYDFQAPIPFIPRILVPGESTPIKSIGREDLLELCGSEESFKRIENWEEKFFIYGKVVYRDLIAADDNQLHETNWCCWYIRGRQMDGLVIAGPSAYNAHT